jgi:hypothetical protein
MKFTRTEEFRPQTVCWDDKEKKGLELELKGLPGAWFVETDNVYVGADLVVNRGWSLEKPEVVAFPVIRNDHGLYHPGQFVARKGKGLDQFNPVKKALLPHEESMYHEGEEEAEDEVATEPTELTELTEPTEPTEATGDLSPDAPAERIVEELVVSANKAKDKKRNGKGAA